MFTSRTFVPLFGQGDHSVVDQWELLIFPNQNSIHKCAVVAIVLHKHLAALLTGRQQDNKALQVADTQSMIHVNRK